MMLDLRDTMICYVYQDIHCRKLHLIKGKIYRAWSDLFSISYNKITVNQI